MLAGMALVEECAQYAHGLHGAIRLEALATLGALLRRQRRCSCDSGRICVWQGYDGGNCACGCGGCEYHLIRLIRIHAGLLVANTNGTVATGEHFAKVLHSSIGI